MPDDAYCKHCKHPRASHQGLSGCKECECLRQWTQAVPKSPAVALKPVPPCGNLGCKHDLERHVLEAVKLDTELDERGEVRHSTMGYKVVCYDVCQDRARKAHQCHCKRYEWPSPPPSAKQLKERP